MWAGGCRRCVATVISAPAQPLRKTTCRHHHRHRRRDTMPMDNVTWEEVPEEAAL
jgi:hypothetical protein